MSLGRAIDYPPEDSNMLDEQLQRAVDDFFSTWKSRVIRRLEMGEAQYHGEWKTMTASEVAKELNDELTDLVAYSIFLNWKLVQKHVE